MRNMKLKGRLWLQLPEDILKAILLRLQVIDLLRCKLVCRRWNFVISSSHFIQLHLKKAISCPSDHRILISGGYNYTSLNYDDAYRDQGINKDLPWPCRYYYSTLLSSYDGLISFVNYANNSICLINPTTRAWKRLNIIESQSNVMFHWFGHDSADDDEYKLVIVASSKEGSFHVHLVNPYADEKNCDSTELINFKYLCLPRNAPGTLFRRRVHWYACERVNDDATSLVPVMFCYDLKLKTIEEVALPDEELNQYATTCVRDGCLSVVRIVYEDEECMFEV